MSPRRSGPHLCLRKKRPWGQWVPICFPQHLTSTQLCPALILCWWHLDQRYELGCGGRCCLPQGNDWGAPWPNSSPCLPVYPPTSVLGSFGFRFQPFLPAPVHSSPQPLQQLLLGPLLLSLVPPGWIMTEGSSSPASSEYWSGMELTILIFSLLCLLYGISCPNPALICISSNPQHLTMWLHLEIGVLKGELY